MASTIPANKLAHIKNHAIEVLGVSKHYGALHAVDGVDLAVEHGEIFGLIGHNGAGKSTLFKMMLGLVQPSAGNILINDNAVTGAAFRQTRRKLGYLPENVVLYDNLSGIETLKFFAKLKGADLAECAPILEKVGLTHAHHRPLREYSKGMRQRLGFAQALLGQPNVLFLDEPTNGLDPQAIRDFYSILRSLRDDGVTIIITSHILAELQERVDRLAIMSAGKIQAVGSVSQLRQQMHMPLTITLQLAAQDLAAAQAALLHLTEVSHTVTNEGLVLRCSRHHKMEVLTALHSLGKKLIDIQVQEPSLEDVFFGFSD